MIARPFELVWGAYVHAIATRHGDNAACKPRVCYINALCIHGKALASFIIVRAGKFDGPDFSRMPTPCS